jgi:Mg2+-importing ATPase
MSTRLGGPRTRTARPGDDLVDAAGNADAHELLRLARLEVDGALRELRSSHRGLSDRQAASRLAMYGLNTLPTARTPNWQRRLWMSLRNPFVLLLVFLDAAVAATGDPRGVALITVMVATSLALRLYHERRFDHLTAFLNDVTGARVAVLRRVGQGDQPASARRRNPRLLVPGDLILLAAGDVVPADCRVVSADGFTIDQTLLTGESMPVPKVAVHPGGRAEGRSSGALLAAPTLCLTGTAVAAGQAIAVVAKTGAATVLGATARTVTAPRRATSADLGLSRVTWLIIRLLCGLVPAVFVLTALGHQGTHWSSAVMFAVAVAVGLVPQMLPVVLTVAHGRGLSALARCGVAVTRPTAVQDLGGMDVLCTDKTGTLTLGAPTLIGWVGPDGGVAPEVLEYGLLSSIFTADPGDSLERAVLARAAPLDRELAETQYDKIGDIAFDTGRRTSTVLLDPGGDRLLAVSKGAVPEVVAMCDRIRLDAHDYDLTPARRALVDQVCRRLWRDGRRLLAVCYRTGDDTSRFVDAGMILVGFLVFTDPAKPGTAETVAQLAACGVRTVVVTGDATQAAVAVAAGIGLPAGRPATGAAIDLLDDDALAALVATTPVFAEVNPLQKARIVRALRARGHTVGYLGDGVNDTPALRAADVGICVAGAVGVARQAADAVMLDKDLRVIENAVVEGRRATLNATKYLKATLSANLGNVLSVLVAGVFLPFLPMLPVQLLAQNLCYDLTQLAVPFDRADPDQLRRPQRWSHRDLVGFIACFALVGSVFDLATFWLLGHDLDDATSGGQSLFHTGWFVQGLVTQTLAVCVIRTAAVPLLRSRPTRPLALATLAGCLAAVLIPYTPAAVRLGFHPLPPAVLAALAVIVVAYLVSLEVAKGFYRRVTGRWL